APHAAEMRALYEARGVPWIDYPAIVAALRAKGLGGINPYLTPAEHQALCDATDVGRTVELLWTGLERLAAGTPAS
ncbi:MAG: hypothetical protein JNL97_00065, partial [Verrucomicrobiales bacterium]|nr:hypothetical protein [Verrucomicrobiales bacterium]